MWCGDLKPPRHHHWEWTSRPIIGYCKRCGPEGQFEPISGLYRLTFKKKFFDLILIHHHERLKNRSADLEFLHILAHVWVEIRKRATMSSQPCCKSRSEKPSAQQQTHQKQAEDLDLKQNLSRNSIRISKQDFVNCSAALMLMILIRHLYFTGLIHKVYWQIQGMCQQRPKGKWR